MRIRVSNTAKLAFVALLLMLVTALSPAVPGRATVNTTPLAGSTFEGADGNTTVDVNGQTDWTNAPNLATGPDLNSGSGDNAFGQGTKENTLVPTIVYGSIPPNKNDLSLFQVGSEFTGGNSYVYLSWNRLVNIGAADIDFELNQVGTPDGNGVTPTRTTGDVLVLYNFGGSGIPSLYIARWLSSGVWSNPVALNGTDSEAGVSADGLFGEAAINLTAAGVFTGTACQHFGSAYTKSRSSNSFTSELKDFIAPIAVNITNCGSANIYKVSGKGGALLTGASFTIAGPNGTSPLTETTTGLFPAANLSLSTPYTVTETHAPTGYALSTPVTQTVNVGSIGTTQNITFTDQPLSNVTLTFHSLAGNGVTNGTVSCSGAGTASGTLQNGQSITTTNIAGTNDITCTVHIDP